MGLSQKALNEEGVPIVFNRRREISVRVGPCTARPLLEKKIPLDGRHYICGGELILNNGRRVRAHFEIHTHDFDFLERSSVWCTLDGDMWYQIDDREFHRLLGLRKSEIFPYRWRPGIPLDYYKRGPYPMKWPEKVR